MTGARTKLVAIASIETADPMFGGDRFEIRMTIVEDGRERVSLMRIDDRTLLSDPIFALVFDSMRNELLAAWKRRETIVAEGA